MAGLEVVVRPVVFPNIRPAPAQSVPPQDDPDKGFAVIRGNGGKQVSLSNSWSASTSTSKHQETQRRVDKARVYQQDDKGTVNRENFVDIEVANKIWMKGPPEQSAGIEDKGGAVPSQAPTTNNVEIQFYRPIQEQKNIEIKKKNYILKSDQEVGPI